MNGGYLKMHTIHILQSLLLINIGCYGYQQGTYKTPENDPSLGQHVSHFIREKEDLNFLAILAQDFAQNISENRKIDFEECAKNSYNSKSYAQCLLPLMKRKLRYMKYEENRRSRFRKYGSRESVEDDKTEKGTASKISTPQKINDHANVIVQEGKWSDAVIGAKNNFPNENIQNDPSRLSADLANILSDLLRNIKNVSGPWARLPTNLDSFKSGQSPRIWFGPDNKDRTIFETSHNSDGSILHNFLDNIMTSPLYLMKDTVQAAKNNRHVIKDLLENRRKRQAEPPETPDENIDILSPRILPLFDNGHSERTKFLSPDFFSFFDSPNSVASIPQLLSGLRITERRAWMKFFLEASGAADYLRFIDTDKFQSYLDRISLSWFDNRTVASSEIFESRIDLNSPNKYATVGEVFEDLNTAQIEEMNRRGFAFLDERQLKGVYGDKLNDDDYMTFNVNAYNKMSPVGREKLIIQIVEKIANKVENNEENPSFVVEEDEEEIHARKKRQITFATPCVSAPYLGGTVLKIYLLAPQIVCPSVFSYVILGPLVLSPYVLSPYVFGPFILSPEVLTPFILSPYVLSPNILNPLVLSPPVLNPTIISPLILSPTVLNPSVLSPSFLNPAILSPSVGSPNILSPYLLNPSVLSPAALFANVLSPGLLSPSVLSPSTGPSILSPCTLCRKKRRRRNVIMNYFETIIRPHA